MKKMSFWILIAFIFLAGFFFVGLFAALAFLVSAVLAPFLDKMMADLMKRNRLGRFWIAELVIAAVLLFTMGGTIALAWLAGAVVADVWG